AVESHRSKERARQRRARSSILSKALHAERLAATAAVFLARVVELEAFIQALAHEVELGAVEVRKTLRIDEHLHAVAFEDHVFRRHVIGVLELVGKPRATRGLHAQANADAFATLVDVARDM